MRKYILIVALAVLSSVNALQAQTTEILFKAPDTVCVNQPVKLTCNNDSGISYYWGFCSGYLGNAPTGTNVGDTFQLHSPSDIDVAQDYTGNYYGFVLNESTTELIRLNYGKSLNNAPTITNLGDLTQGLPINPTSVFIVKDTFSGNWYLFVTGGYTRATSTLARIDFGPSLGNPRPNIANFGNRSFQFDGPKGVWVAQDANNQWFGYLVNYNTNELIRLDFSYNISNTPIVENLGNPKDRVTTLPLLSKPTDIAPIFDNGKWYMFISNEAGNDVCRIDLGTGLDTTFFGPTAANGANLGNFLYRINAPSSLSINRDCGSIYVYITDSTTSQLVALQMPAAIGPYYPIDYGIVGAMNLPSGISTIIRDSNSLYGFITNAYDSSITKVDFQSCYNSTIPSYRDYAPPIYSYDSPGIYNVYLVINQGLPTIQTECQQITVLPIPSLNLPHDTTICEGDTIKLWAVTNTADSFFWSPPYNIDTIFNYVDSVRVWPAYSTGYNVKIFYPYGCIVDTTIHVKVSEVHADAGPDRTIQDGAYTLIGGAYTSLWGNYAYGWESYQYLSDTTIPNPVANPPNDYTYFLTVKELNDELGCIARDTVVVHVVCGEITLPNAFAPSSGNPNTATFGILNQLLPRLNYFRIFDRWGTLVFETSDPTQRWDGTYKNKPCLPDVYVWETDGFCPGGKEIKNKGNVTLLR